MIDEPEQHAAIVRLDDDKTAELWFVLTVGKLFGNLRESLIYLRDRLDVSETYRLGLGDLEYLELLPAEPELIGPEECEGAA